MALKKTIYYPTGITAEYHKITGFIVDRNEGKYIVNVSSYINEAARLNGCFPVHIYTFSFEMGDTSFVYSLEDMYGLIKSLDFFSNCDDV